MSDFEVITLNLQGACVSRGKQIHGLFRIVGGTDYEQAESKSRPKLTIVSPAEADEVVAK